jgi:predicted RND superfamily exporter protein
MAEPGPFRACCPDCGYDIMGVRDMVCPECGRALSVLDFNPDTQPRTHEIKRYERTDVIAGAMGVVVLLLFFAPVALLVLSFARFGFVPLLPVLIGVALLAWIVALIGFTGRSLFSWATGKRRRR